MLLTVGAALASPHTLFAAQDAREILNGLVPAPAAISEAHARQECVPFAVAPPNDRILGPHGDTLISTQCRVVAFERLDPARPATWSWARYEWVSVFTAEDTTRGPSARDTAPEEEVVLFEASAPGEVRPVWHVRFDTSPYAVWRSMTPEVATTAARTTLLSVMSCVNGTGGCGQDFLQRHADGRWFPVEQKWLEQLPKGYNGRIRHGVRIDPRTLRADAGFYRDDDPNCCPSQEIVVDLALRGDTLVLRNPPTVRDTKPDR